MKSEPNLATSSRDEKFCIAILKSCAILKSRNGNAELEEEFVDNAAHETDRQEYRDQ